MSRFYSYSGAAISAGGIIPNAWTTIDVSAIVGARQVMLYCKLFADNVNTVSLVARHKVTSRFTTGTTQAGGKGYSCCNALNNCASAFMTLTDSNGQFEIIEPTGVLKVGWVYLLGWFVPTVSTETVVTASEYMYSSYSWLDKTIPAAFQTDTDALLMLEYAITGTGSAEELSVRPYKATGEYASEGTPRDGGINNVIAYPNSTTYYYELMTPTNNQLSGGYQHSTGSGPFNAAINIQGIEDTAYKNYFVNLYTAQSFPVYSTSWTTVDLSTHVGAAECLVFLRVENRTAGNGRLLARPHGDSNNWVLSNNATYYYGTGPGFTGDLVIGEANVMVAKTDANGIIDIANYVAAGATYTIDLIGFLGPYEKVPLVITLTQPASGLIVDSSDYAEHIIARLSDETGSGGSGTGIVNSSLQVYFEDMFGNKSYIVQNGVVVNDCQGDLFYGTAGLGGSSSMTIDLHVMFPHHILIDGKKYNLTFEATNFMGESL